MQEPTLILEWLLADTWIPFDTTPRSASYKRGKSRALDKNQPGTMTVTLPNGDRSYDPEHNVLFQSLGPGSGMRLRAEWNLTEYTLFTGYLERITQDFGDPDKPNDATITFDVVDGLSILASAGMKSAWENVIQNLGPRAWLRLGEENGSMVAFDRAGPYHGVYFGNPDPGVTGLIDGDNDKAMTLPVGANYLILTPGFLPTTAEWTVSFMVYVPAAPAGPQFLIYDYLRPKGFRVYMDPTGTITCNVADSAGTVQASKTTGSALLFNPYLISIVARAGQQLKIYNGDVDLGGFGSGTNHSLAVTSQSYMVVGLPDYQPVTMDELMTFDRALTEAELQEMEHAAGAWIHDTIWDRVDKILDIVGWDATLRDITNEQDDMLKGFAPTTALEHLQAIETTMEGRLWVTPDGTLKLLGRNDHVQYYADVEASFSDSGDLPYVRLGPYVKDWTLLANVVRRINGETSIPAIDVDSILEYGLRDQSPPAEVESLYLTLAAEQDLASWRLDHYKEPVPHIDGIELFPANDPVNLWPQVLERDLSGRVSFERTPQGVGSPIAFEAIIEGIKVDIKPKSWRVRYQIDAAYARRYFLFDDTVWDSDDWRFAA